jgi:hypothetical protein
MLLVEDATFDLMPKTGIAVVGVEGDEGMGKLERKGIVTALAEDMRVLAILIGPHLDEQLKAVLPSLPYAKRNLRCTFLECNEEAAFEHACKLYHREWQLADTCEHPERAGWKCPVPLCDGI